MKILTKAVAIIATTTLALAGSLPASADTLTAPDDSQRVEREIKALLRLHPGSHRVAVNAVELEPNVIATVPPADTGEVSTNALLGCADFYICLSEHRNFGGYGIRFKECKNVNLSKSAMPDGRLWNDKVSSIRNAQSSGIYSSFYSYDGSGGSDNPANWQYILSLQSRNYLRDLTANSSASGGNANDKIDIVSVC